jgi:nicotinate-nucleotide adenylyltransferase
MGLLGGTFDPPHYGHLMVAQEAVERLALDFLVFLVAGLPPHKEGEVVSAPGIRLEMTRAAVDGNASFQVSDVELRRPGPSYTVDTLRHFREEYPGAELFFVLGADQLAELHEWREPEKVMEMATLVAVERDGVDPSLTPPLRALAVESGRLLALPSIRLDLSSSEVRARVREGRSVQYLVPEGVRRIIENHRLYRSMS